MNKTAIQSLLVCLLLAIKTFRWIVSGFPIFLIQIGLPIVIVTILGTLMAVVWFWFILGFIILLAINITPPKRQPWELELQSYLKFLKFQLRLKLRYLLRLSRQELKRFKDIHLSNAIFSKKRRKKRGY